MSTHTYTERYFPPPGALPVHTSGDAPYTGGTWFPLHLLLEHLGRCSRCPNPASYILAGTCATTFVAHVGPGATFACLPVCATDVCDLAALTEAGHDQCPKCHADWCIDPGITAEFLAPALAGGA